MIQAVIIFSIWMYMARTSSEGLIPTPIETLTILADLVASGTAIEHLAATSKRVFIAFFIIYFISLTIGIIMGSTNYWKSFLKPYALIGMVFPGVIWGVGVVIAIGFGDISAVTITVLGAVPFPTILFWRATENIDTELIQMGNSFDLSTSRTIRRIIIPNVAPELFATARFGLGLTFKSILIAELFASSVGVGVKVYETFDAFRYQEAWAWAIIILSIILVTETVLRRIETKTFEYREEGELENIGGVG
ncbi:ABC transporter permease [Halobellus rufus]|uniref:ABC transporter permease n=1 Tax=Halobellus rufus TaxID=1448860 RepID=UPI00067901C1|nr:ABC transporter permease subunit [Halobellus rufus]